MRCTLEQAEQAHRAATFVTHEEARNYAAYRNAMAIKYGTDNVSKIRFKDIETG